VNFRFWDHLKGLLMADLGRTLSFEAWLSNVRYRFLSPVSCHSAIGQTKPQTNGRFSDQFPRSGPTGVHLYAQWRTMCS